MCVPVYVCVCVWGGGHAPTCVPVCVCVYMFFCFFVFCVYVVVVRLFFQFCVGLLLLFWFLGEAGGSQYKL